MINHYLNKKSETGFALIWTIFLLPILISICFFLFKSLGRMVVQHQLQRNCENTIAEGQKKVIPIIKSLMKLNKPIQVAKVLRQSGYLLVATGTTTYNPALIAQGTQMIKSANLTLDSLKATQNLLLINGESILQSTASKAVSELKRISKKNENKQKQQLQLLKIKILPKYIGHLAVKPKMRNSEYPEYELDQPFSQKQQLVLSWQVQTSETQENKKWSHLKTNQIQNCGATLVEINSNQVDLQVRLTEDKYYWRLLF